MEGTLGGKSGVLNLENADFNMYLCKMQEGRKDTFNNLANNVFLQIKLRNLKDMGNLFFIDYYYINTLDGKKEEGTVLGITQDLDLFRDKVKKWVVEAEMVSYKVVY
ncbi:MULTISPECIES: hypothetical protein [Pontibacillus]|uniref:Uncharacterized protein n=1 Tax=Pontibacillus chungwhensis TaxID=265426 RepID=A0ABY8V642_9BACI|nr:MULTISPECIES: hypothetical protein [Pontibacillus]MCD5326165.1 hypothetical protein [Pontibacillus sp. HN14]WIG00320.1 hypothetical protein QNI29_20955 [Pontibacillus chungwhensis]